MFLVLLRYVFFSHEAMESSAAASRNPVNLSRGVVEITEEELRLKIQQFKESLRCLCGPARYFSSLGERPRAGNRR